MMPCKGKKFMQDFVNRTKHNYENTNEKYKVTQLINSTVGLLFVPKETEYGKIADSDIPAELLNKLCSKSCLKENTYSEPLNVQQIARHLRNAVSHGTFECMSDDPYIGEGHPIITHIQFKDRNKYSKKHEKLEMLIHIDDLKEFLFALSDAIARKTAE